MVITSLVIDKQHYQNYKSIFVDTGNIEGYNNNWPALNIQPSLKTEDFIILLSGIEVNVSNNAYFIIK